MATNRLVIDPVTRIEGHLRIEAVLTDQTVSAAYISGTMVRGLEIILRGRDPREAWIFAQRICGVCTLVHGIAAVRAVENALNYPIPANAQLIRNLMIATQFIHDHVMHFYHLQALDWVDMLSALNANPVATARLAKSVSDYPHASAEYFAEIQKKLKNFIESGQQGIFAQGYWGHPAYKLPAEVNLMVVSHYFEALRWQRDIVKLHTIFGGKNPHPNLVVGGVPCAIDFDSTSALNAQKFSQVQDFIKMMRDFIVQVYLPDVIAIASYYKAWASLGEGLGNFMTYQDFSTSGINDQGDYFIPPGVILQRNLSEIYPVDLRAFDHIGEDVSHSWYHYSTEKTILHPHEGETVLNYTGPQPPYTQLDVDNTGYSWIKAPRWQGQPVEVGPLARVLMLYATGYKPMKTLVDTTLNTLALPIESLFSTLGRTVSRALETQIIAERMQDWYDNLLTRIHSGETKTFNDQFWQPNSWPKHAEGMGWMEAPRGSLGHWIVIDEGKISNYQAVVPTTWNASPRDAQGQSGAYETALLHHTVQDSNQPLEILRTIRSFDPCIACAVHLISH